MRGSIISVSFRIFNYIVRRYEHQQTIHRCNNETFSAWVQKNKNKNEKYRN